MSGDKMLRLGLNLLWFILIGWLNFIAWIVAGIILAVTIIGIPWAKAAFTLASFTAWPVGRDAVSRYDLTGQHDIGTGGLGLLGNIVWFVLAGWYLVLTSLLGGVYLFCTIIGIPLAIQQFKIAGISLAPIGKTIVSKEVAKELAKRKAARTIDDAQRRAQEKADAKGTKLIPPDRSQSALPVQSREPQLIASQAAIEGSEAR
jgi:uncharacterized membrane protein YccF (DUF307 family)